LRERVRWRTRVCRSTVEATAMSISTVLDCTKGITSQRMARSTVRNSSVGAEGLAKVDAALGNALLPSST